MKGSETISSKEYFVGIDIGGTNTKAIVMSREGIIFYEKIIPTENEKGPKEVIKKIISLMNNFIYSESFAHKKLYAIGVAVAGVVNMKEGICKFLPNFPTGWRNIPLAKIIKESIDCQVFLINDVRAMTLGEKTFGAGRGVKNLICIALGTGIGGGIIIDDKLYFGSEGFAGEIGHQTIDLYGPKCGCGNYGCWESLASGTNLTVQAIRLVKEGATTMIRDLVDNDLNKINPEIIVEAATRGDSIAKEILEKEAYFLGAGIANLLVILNPEMIILGGGMAKAINLLVGGIRKTIHQRVYMGPNVDKLRIVRSELQDKAGAVGAATWAMLNLSKI